MNILKHMHLSDIYGSRNYKKKKYNNKVDIWSLGCIIHELCTLNFCFENQITDKSSQNYIIERNIQNSLDQILSRENKINNIKFYSRGVMVFPLFFALWHFLRPISLIATYIIGSFTGKEIGSIVDKIINGNEKLEFINKN